MESLGDILRNIVASRQANNPDSAAPGPEEVERCPVCHDAGFIHPALHGGKPDYSRVVPCDCTITKLEAGRMDFLQRYSNLGPLAERTFDNFICPPAPGGPLAAAAARSFAEKPDGWLVLVGPSGSGKTHLAAAIANRRLALGHPAAFSSISDLLDHLRATFHPSSAVSYDSLFEKVRNAPLLVLDDLGRQNSTTWSTEKLDQIINHRFNMRLPTVFTTSFPPEDLEERWSTRLRDPRLSHIIVLARPDDGEPPEELEAMEHLRHMTFDNFRWKRVELLLEDRQALEAAFNNALEFARQPDGWLVLEGAHGCGKTHLAAAIANFRVKQGKPARFMFIPDLLDRLRSTFNSDNKSSHKVFEKIKNAPLLVLDDLGGNSATAWAQEKLFQLINHRYAARLPTVFTIARKEELDERLRSRLDDASLVISSPAMKRPFYVSEEPQRKSNIKMQKSK